MAAPRARGLRRVLSVHRRVASRRVCAPVHVLAVPRSPGRCTRHWSSAADTPKAQDHKYDAPKVRHLARPPPPPEIAAQAEMAEAPHMYSDRGPSQINWYPGHMARAMRLMRERLSSVHMVVEVRDARIPMSSFNTDLAVLVKDLNKKRVIVLNKADLIPASKQARRHIVERIQEMEPGARVFFVSMSQPSTLRDVFQAVQEDVLATKRFRTLPCILMVVGFPNVGKSTLINCMRTKLSGGDLKSVAKTGALPGVTRHIGGFEVCRKPPIVVMDTPGIMLPRFEDTPVQSGAQQAIKLALTGAISDRVAGVGVQMMRLHAELNRSPAAQREYMRFFNLQEPAASTNDLIRGVSRFIDGPLPGEEEEGQGQGELTADRSDKAQNFLLKQYRSGGLGRWLLDEDILGPTPASPTPAPSTNTHTRAPRGRRGGGGRGSG